MAQMTRGFKTAKKHMEKTQGRLRCIRDCKTCDSYGVGDVCTNNAVTEFDMTYEDHKQYCSFWTPTMYKSSKE